jgi:CRP-like cAMP-binding protein
MRSGKRKYKEALMHLTTDLAEHSVLAGLSDHHLDILDRAGALVHFRPGRLLFERGKEANRFFLLQSGRVSLEIFTPQRGPMPVQILGPGELLGSSWLVPPYRWQFDARALDDTAAFSFDAQRVQEACENDHELGYQLLSRCFIAISQRLSAAQEQILGLFANRLV